MQLTRRRFTQLSLSSLACLSLGHAHAQTPATVETLLSKGFYVSNDTQCVHWCRQNPQHPHQPLIQQEIAVKAAARWINEGDPRQKVDSYLREAEKAGKLGVMVAYNVPDRDFSGQSTGGAANADAYAAWATQFAQAIGSRPCMVVLEPDSIMLINKKEPARQQLQFDTLNRAIDAFATYAPNAWVYADAGNGMWPTAEEIAPLLAHLHTDKLRGFSINVSNFNTDEQCGLFAKQLLALMAAQGTPLRGWVYDSARNGNGPAPDYAWCNPPARKIGKAAAAGTAGADANLWIKPPGESDGYCGAYPEWNAGYFSPQIAYDLIKGI